jgi:hypothetical protein
MSQSLRRSCISAAWDARKIARRMRLMGQETNARHALEIKRAYLNEARRLRGLA